MHSSSSQTHLSHGGERLGKSYARAQCGRAEINAPAAPIVGVVVAVRNEGVLAQAQLRRRDGGLLGGFVRRESDQVHEDRALGGRNAFDRPKVLQSGPKSSLVFVRWHSPEAEQPVVLRWARRKLFDLKNPARDTHRTNA